MKRPAGIRGLLAVAVATAIVWGAGCAQRFAQNAEAENTAPQPRAEEPAPVEGLPQHVRIKPGKDGGAWTEFMNEDSTLIGYKDEGGAIRIEPVFGADNAPAIFNNIIIVYDEKIRKSYYLTKAGKIFGVDSAFYFDNTPDLECKGFIRFRDRKTENVGMFNRYGDVVIPAEYNYLSPAVNGTIIALKGAEKPPRVHDGGCDHRGFTGAGGANLLIDTLNNVLIEDFDYDNGDFNLNFFSIEKTETPHPDTARVSFPAKGGGYYSFIDFEKEFSQWLAVYLLPDLSPQKLIAASDSVIEWQSKYDRCEKVRSRQFIADNFEFLKKDLPKILSPDYNCGIGQSFIYSNCCAAEACIYPVMEISISHSSLRDNDDYRYKPPYQNHYRFARTDSGYKFVYADVGNAELKVRGRE